MGRSAIKSETALRALVQKAAAAAEAVPDAATARKRGNTGNTSNAARVAASAAGEIRIIGGQWRRTKLAVLTRPDLRPTPDRVRETLFNWLGQDLAGWRCLDAFAGTGVLGLEAASRNATQVRMVESDVQLAAQIKQLAQKLGATQVEVSRGDALAALQAYPAHWDLIFIDPPFSGQLFAPALKAAQAAVTAQGFIYLEAPEAWSEEALAELGLVSYRYLKAGAVHAHLLKKAAPVEG
ncbi:16S rRNA (guanine(966)-N(2))-methyltransferase RsmD [Comamonas piscis]|uniref:16S rRNA (Guanine(966)-N(2))-methyltransferase RsmD n=1 Tax=Comamonas piscis TaxID=1562974 RepID=A0A7G5EFA1_9BURK|nr:16S rRNA (guanine(966)-N(2))-methyltransferase RsmD [Comamonas piscis]QMV72676.1 16S rRNA (guanine(966)-N(2))-methyltransferase RsmD [Comamonas piscis]WSO35448.1 16S rRNA (guanine(966)-N(2))-methyltransferase RsmD [Comamonas piscis]